MSQQAPAVTSAHLILLSSATSTPPPAALCSSSPNSKTYIHILHSLNNNNQRMVLCLHTMSKFASITDNIKYTFCVSFDISDKELCKLAPVWFTVGTLTLMNCGLLQKISKSQQTPWSHDFTASYLTTLYTLYYKSINLQVRL